MLHIKNSILDEMQKKRDTMIDLAQKYGYTSCDTVKCSQELDQLIYQYQRFFHDQSNQHETSKGKVKYMLVFPK